MKCENCGAELREGSVYCMVCGKPVQIVPDYNAFDDYLDNLVGEDKSSSIEKNPYNNKNTIRQAQQPVKRPVKDHKEDSKVKTEVVKKKKQQKKMIIISVIVIIIALIILTATITVNIKKQHDNSVDYQIKMAKESLKNGDTDDAVSYYDKALSLDSDNTDVRFSLAEIYMDQKDIDAAKILYQEIISIDPDNVEAYKALISTYEDEKDYDAIVALSNESDSSDVKKLFDPYIVDEPQFSPAAGKYEEVTDVRIKADSDVKIYYTLDNSDPKENGKIYSNPIHLDGERTYKVKAVAVDSRGIYSDIVSKEYKIEFKEPDAPVVDPDGGTFGAQSYITMTAEDNCKIYYTWDGSDPDESSSEYTEPVEIPVGNNVLSVIAIDQTTGKCSDIYRNRYEFYAN